MKVIASIKYEDRKSRSRRITVRKCPPNYKPQEGEYVVELEDYTEEDIKEYFEKPGIEWRGWAKKKLKKLKKQRASEAEIKHWKEKHEEDV